MIEPTIGRVVWYHPTPDNPGAKSESLPQAAMVCNVWSDTCVNLVVFDANGVPYNVTSVLLYQDEGERPDVGFAEWMPYQKQQAEKAEQTEEVTA